MKKIKSLFLTAIITSLIFPPRSHSQQYVPVNRLVTTESADQGSPAIVVDPLNPNHLEATWDDTRGTGLYVPGSAFSTDGGNSWSVGNEITLPSGYFYGFNTSCGIDAAGNEYCAYTTKYDASPGSIPKRIYISVTTGDAFTPSSVPYPVSPLGSYQDKPYMTIDNTTGRFGGRIYVAWTDFSSGSAILVSSSVDHGHSWSTPVNVSQNSGNTGAGTYADPVLGKTQKLPSPPGPFVQDAIPAVGPDGTLYVVFLSVNGTGQDGSPGWI